MLRVRHLHQRPVPKVFASISVLVVLDQPLAHIARLADIHARQARLRQLADQKIHAHLQSLGHLQKFTQLAARHIHHPNNRRSDLSHPHPARVACGEVDWGKSR
jgi:hypothetical protein